MTYPVHEIVDKLDAIDRLIKAMDIPQTLSDDDLDNIQGLLEDFQDVLLNAKVTF